MAMPQALNSPNGNGPQDINSPVPTQGAGPAGGSPAANLPAGGAGAPGGAGGAPAAVPRQQSPNPFDTPLSQEEQERLKQIKAGVTNPFDEKDPNFPSGYQPLSPRLRRNPAGDLEHLRNDGKWAPLGDTEKKILGDFIGQVEKWGLRTKEDLPRFFGSVVGGLFGDYVAGGAGATAGAAAGQALAGAASNALQGHPNSVGTVAADAVGGAASELLPRGVAQGLEKQAAAWGSRAVEAPIVTAGVQALKERANGRQGAADALGLTLRPDQIMPENGAVTRPVDQIMSSGGPEAQKLAAAQALQKQMLLEKRDQIVSRLQGPYQGEIGDQGANFSQVLGTILNNHETAIASLKQQAFKQANGKVFPVDPVLNTMKETIQDKVKANIFKDDGSIDGRLLQELKDRYGGIPEDAKGLVGDYMRLFNSTKVGGGIGGEVGGFRNTSPLERTAVPVGGNSDAGVALSMAGGVPRESPGLTLEEMEVYRKKFGDYANFHATRERTSAERAYGDIYYSLRSHMDSKIIDTMKDTDPMAAQRLMAHKEFYSQFKEDAIDFQKKIEHDPANAATALVDGQDPAKVKSLLALVDDKQRKYLAGGFLDSLTKPIIDENGKMRVTPVETAWRKVDPKVKQMLFGEDAKQIDALVNYSRALENRDMTNFDPTKDAVVKRAFGAIQGIKETSKGSLDFISRLFQKTPKARDYLVGNAADILLPEGGSPTAMARRQMLLNHAAQTTLSMPARAGAKAIGADFGESFSRPSPAPSPEAR
ncbi:MAG TPA: hypothetical protein VN613_04750 [Gemmatimonadaceae bacterium]|nr:hypothetical protein [Gemmatimonadaceae bacterium]